MPSIIGPGEKTSRPALSFEGSRSDEFHVSRQAILESVPMTVQPFSEPMIVAFLDSCQYEAERPTKGTYFVDFLKEEPSEILGSPVVLMLSKEGSVFRISMAVPVLEWNPIVLTQYCNNWNMGSYAPIKISQSMPTPDVAGFEQHMQRMSAEEREAFDLSQYPIPPLQPFVETELVLDLGPGIHQELFDAIVSQCVEASFKFFDSLEGQDMGVGEDDDEDDE